MPVMYQDWIQRDDLKRNRDSSTGYSGYYRGSVNTEYLRYYLFGDNVARVGRGGQAKAMRDEPNAIGIATKNGPTMNPKDMWIEKNHTDFITFKNIIDKDLEAVYDVLEQDGLVVIPTDGLGTGLSKLPTNAPLTNEYLDNLLFNELPARYGVFESKDWKDHLPSPSVENRFLVFIFPKHSRDNIVYTRNYDIGTGRVIGAVGRVCLSYYNENGRDIDEWVDYNYPQQSGYWVGHMDGDMANHDGYLNPKKWRRAIKQDFEEMGIEVPLEFKGK